MRKKRGHPIIVDNVRYIWSVKRIDKDYVLLRVQVAEHRNRGVLQVRFAFFNHWAYFGLAVEAYYRGEEGRERYEKFVKGDPITPSLVQRIIKAARENDWSPEEVRQPISYEWRNERLLLIEDATLPGIDPITLPNGFDDLE